MPSSPSTSTASFRSLSATSHRSLASSPPPHQRSSSSSVVKINGDNNCQYNASGRPSEILRSITLDSLSSQMLLADQHHHHHHHRLQGISGVLYKWVNYGRGWRPRWFVLEDGVLSYYKIHGPNKIIVNHETERGSKVIGEISLRRMARCNTVPSRRRSPVGEIHLKVSSIRDSRSDDRRFSIFTGTKRLHLRAETREDRVSWMEALQAVKDMFPRISNSELMASLSNGEYPVVSTEKLRQRLMEEGLNEAAIQDSELIMRTEFLALRNHYVVLKQKQSLLLDTLRQLEVEYHFNEYTLQLARGHHCFLIPIFVSVILLLTLSHPLLRSGETQIDDRNLEYCYVDNFETFVHRLVMYPKYAHCIDNFCSICIIL